ncbi:MAG: hypothetical protein K2O18_15440, partial [Oscillospiraceae bacterium]|nr:hypothetical protein [Oscillospiraceae bacterium]
WGSVGEINLYHNMPLFQWHVLSNCFPDEKADRQMLAYACKYQGQWLLVNHGIQGMMSPGGSLVPAGQAILLKDGAVFRMSSGEKGYVAEVVRGR